jgi:hypothetical protein
VKRKFPKPRTAKYKNWSEKIIGSAKEISCKAKWSKPEESKNPKDIQRKPVRQNTEAAK